jgi:hypothetical protein
VAFGIKIAACVCPDKLIPFKGSPQPPLPEKSYPSHKACSNSAHRVHIPLTQFLTSSSVLRLNKNSASHENKLLLFVYSDPLNAARGLALVPISLMRTKYVNASFEM